MKIKAFILSAGFGTRLRPLTYLLPKPLVPLLGKPLLHYILYNLSKCPIKEIALNLHHLGEKIEKWLEREGSSYPSIKFFYEKTILGTGGALKNAQNFLSDSPFLVHNGDVWTNFSLKELIDFHLKEKPVATLLTLENSTENKLYVDREGNLLGVQGYLEPKEYEKKQTFTGIALYEPEVLDYIPEGFSSVVESWIKLLREGKQIQTLPLKGVWFDFGSFPAYFQGMRYFLKERGEKAYFHEEADCEALEFNGIVSVESKTIFKEGGFLRDVIVYAPNRVISESFEKGILVEDQFIPLTFEEAEEEISLGGSERKFFRLSGGLVKMKASSDLEELERTYEYNLFLTKQGIKVPGIKGISIEMREILFEDLGDLSLYTWLKVKRNPCLIEAKYKEVLEELLKIHTLSLNTKPNFKIFDYEHFRWESRYFEEKFLGYLCGMKSNSLLEGEFERLARLCDTFPKNLIHRDFQSQNIMLKDGKPYIIDYQSARIGPAGYDLASLLWDPYYKLEDNLREKLIEFYIEKRKEREEEFRKESLRESLPYLCIQRHMQALGAYVNLAYFKGKRYFLKFIPQALEYLREEAEAFSFKHLREALEEAQEILIKRRFYEEIKEVSL